MQSERFEMRLDQRTIERVDAWRAEQDDVPSRAEAIRRLVDGALNTGQRKPVSIDETQKLMIFMLCDLYKGVKERTELDPKFIEDALVGGHHWALRWQYPGIFDARPDDEAVVSEVVDILDMWSFLEHSFDHLPQEDQERVKAEAEAFGDRVRFPGFDGNSEITQYSIARFLIEKMDRFSSSFAGRDVDAHCPVIDGYRRMLRVFLPIRSSLTGGRLSVRQILSIFKEWVHPQYRG